MNCPVWRRLLPDASPGNSADRGSDMKIELRSIKHSAFASQETNCFEATVYIDGKKAGTVHNSGHGGCHFYYPRTLQERLDEHAKTLPAIVCEDMKDPHDPSKPFTYQPDADSVIDRLLTDHLIERDLKRALGKRILFVKDGKLMQTKTLRKEAIAHYMLPANLERVKQQYGTDTILNAMPLAEALAIYRKFAEAA